MERTYPPLKTQSKKRTPPARRANTSAVTRGRIGESTKSRAAETSGPPTPTGTLQFLASSYTISSSHSMRSNVLQIRKNCEIMQRRESRYVRALIENLIRFFLPPRDSIAPHTNIVRREGRPCNNMPAASVSRDGTGCSGREGNSDRKGPHSVRLETVMDVCMPMQHLCVSFCNFQP